MYNVTIQNNCGINGGSIYFISNTQNNLQIVNSSFINNTANKNSTTGGNGGAILVLIENLNDKPNIIDNSTCNRNYGFTGGAIFLKKDTYFNISRSSFYENSAINGGAIYNLGGGFFYGNKIYNNKILDEE